MKNAERETNWLEQSAWTLVRSGKRLLALPSSVIALSTLAPKIHTLPFAPPHVRGIAHLNGDVMPCLELAVLLGMQKDQQASGEALVIDWQERKVVLLIDQAVRQLTISEADREHISVMESEGNNGSIVLAEWTLDGRNIFLLDPSFLIHFSAERHERKGRPGMIADHDAGGFSDVRHDQLDSLYLYVRVGDQRFALPVLDCSEIVELDEISNIPGSSQAISGLALIRNISYLVVDSAACLGVQADQVSQAIIVRCGDDSVLFAVSAIESVRAIPRHQVRKIGSDEALLSAVIEVPGESLRAVLSPGALGQKIPDLQRYIPDASHTEMARQETVRTVRFLLVKWGLELFAFSLSSVDCLTPPARIKPVNSDSFSGMINVDGDVLPVIESEFFYGRAEQIDAPEGFIILSHEQQRFAVLMERAEGIIDVAEADIQTSRAGGDDRFTATLRYNNQLISQISLNHFSALVGRHQEAPE